MGEAGHDGRLYLTRRIWLPQKPLERFNLRMGERLANAMPDLPSHGRDALALLPELGALQQSHDQIKKELVKVLESRDAIPNLQDVHPRDDNISSREWLTYVMKLWGHEISENVDRCPETAAATRRIPRVHTILFSILDPGGVIRAHRGWAAGVIRCHYPLITPDPEEECWIEVAGHRFAWHEGEPLLFDDTREHHVRNDTDGLRVVLIVDFEPTFPPLAWAYSKLRYQLVRHSEEIQAIARRSIVVARPDT